MIDIFETQQDYLPREIYFVPSPANGTMDYDIYYQHVRLHHAHISNLRSFAIENVRDITTEITIFDADGVSNPRQMALDDALLSQTKAGSNDTLFYSIEPTQNTSATGRYLLVTHKDNIKEAEQFIDKALSDLNGNTGNCKRVQLTNAPIARANRISTSPRFQEYATKLRNMIPTTIDLPASTPTNAWKRRPTPTTINLTDDTFPPLTHTKRPKQTPDNGTTTTSGTSDSSSSDIDLSTFTDELAKLRQESDAMQRKLQEQFKEALRDVEICMEQCTQSLVASMGQTLNQAVEHMTLQASKNNERMVTFLKSFQKQADRLTSQVERIVANPTNVQSPDSTPLRRT
jgi:hypothetical protein